MNFIRAYSHRNRRGRQDWAGREQLARLVTRPEQELFRDDVYNGESDDVTLEDGFYANNYDLEAQATMVIDVEAQAIVLTPREDMTDPNFIPDPPRLQRSRNVQPVYVGMEPRQLMFDGPEPLDGWDSDSLSTVSMTTHEDNDEDEDEMSVSEL